MTFSSAFGGCAGETRAWEGKDFLRSLWKGDLTKQYFMRVASCGERQGLYSEEMVIVLGIKKNTFFVPILNGNLAEKGCDAQGLASRVPNVSL